MTVNQDENKRRLLGEIYMATDYECLSRLNFIITPSLL